MTVSGGFNTSTANGVVVVDQFEQGWAFNLSEQLPDPKYQTKSAAQIESELGLLPGVLSQFDPESVAGGVEHNGLITAWEGNYGSFSIDIPSTLDGQFFIGFDWIFFNGENTVAEVSIGFNDFVALVITDPEGVKTVQLITSSEQANLAKTVNGLFSSAFDLPGTYSFDWIVMDGRDNTKDSAIKVSGPKISLNGDDFFALPLALDVEVSSVSSIPGEVLTVNISGVPTGSIFSSGTDQGNGEWLFTEAELDGLLWFPPLGFDGDVEFIVTASTELNGVTLTTEPETLGFAVDLTDNVNLNDQATDDVLLATVMGDFMFGGLGADTFKWDLSSVDFVNWGFAPDEFSEWVQENKDIVGDFTLGEFGTVPNADRLSIKDLISFNSADDNILDFISVEQVGSNAVLNISHLGDGETTQIIELRNVDLTTLGSSDEQIITQLITNGNLVVE